MNRQNDRMKMKMSVPCHDLHESTFYRRPSSLFSLLSTSGQLERWIQLRSENRVSETRAVKAGEDLTKKMLQLYPTLD